MAPSLVPTMACLLPGANIADSPYTETQTVRVPTSSCEGFPLPALADHISAIKAALRICNTYSGERSGVHA